MKTGVALQKHYSRQAVARAVSKGKLVRQPCEVCGEAKSEGHHYNGYENKLDVKWLCHKHHMELHRTHPPKDPLQPKACEHCGNEFRPLRSTAKYCSTKCRVYAKRSSETQNILKATTDAFNEAWLEKDLRSNIITEGTTPKEITEISVDESKSFDFCKHEAVKGFCKKGCK